MIYTVLTIIIYVLVFLFIANKIENAIYIALIDSLLPIRFYSILYGIPFSIIFLASILFSFGIIRPKLNLKTGWYINILIVITIYFLISNWDYFRHFDYTILNNLILLFILQIVISRTNILKVWYTLNKVAVLTGFLLLVDVVLRNITLFGNPRQLGFYLIICLVFCLSGRILKPKAKLFSNTVVLIFTLGILFTLGRLNLAITFIILISYYFLRTKVNIKKILLLGFFMIVIGVSFVSFGGIQYFARDTQNVENIKLSSKDANLGAFSSGRSVIYQDLWKMFIDNPLFGNGYKSFNDKNNSYNSIGSHASTQKISAHSVFLQYLSETGIIGFSLYYIFLFSLLLFKFKTKQKELTRDLFLSSYSFVLKTLGLVMILGSLLDNHGIHYKHVFIVLAFMFFMKQYLKHIENIQTPIFKLV